MEKLRNTDPIPQEFETAGTATYPDIIKVATNTPGRAIDENINFIRIKRSYNFYLLKNLGFEEKEDKAAKFYINGSDLNESPTNIFSPDKNIKSIRIPAEERAYHPETGQLLPKEKAIGAMVHFSLADTYPPIGHLARILVEDNNYDAATAAFFLSRDQLHATFRTRKTPQLNKASIQAVIHEFSLGQTWLIEKSRMSPKKARKEILKKAVEKYSLKHFHGPLSGLRLYEGIPEID